MGKYIKSVTGAAEEGLMNGGILYASKALLDAVYGMTVNYGKNLPILSSILTNQVGALAFKPALAFLVAGAADEYSRNKWVHRIAEGVALASVFELASTLADPVLYGTTAAPGPILRLSGVAATPAATSGRISATAGRITGTGARRVGLPYAVASGPTGIARATRMGRNTSGMVTLMG